MTRPCISSAGLLLLLLVGCTAAGPADLRPGAVRSSACQEQTNLHNRLDVVEKRVESTVEKLEAELASLLDAVESDQWRHLLTNSGKTTVDILQDPEHRDRS